MQTKYKYNHEELRDQAMGQWGGILSILAPELECALEKAPRHVPCPMHGGKDGFRLYEDFEKTGGGICNTCGAMPNGFQVLQWIRGWNFYQALEAVSEVLNGGAPVVQCRENANGFSSRAHRKDDGNLRKLLNRMGTEAIPLDAEEAEPARAYLQSRGITMATIRQTTGLRYHPSMAYFSEEGQDQGRYPGMVAMLTDGQGQPVTLHRIYLTQDGRKAPVDFPKKTMPYPANRILTGAAVRLGPAEDLLGVAEGVETALAVTQATGMICWATTSATLLSKVILPAQVKRVVVWADHDTSKEKAGQIAGTRLATRLVEEGIKARVQIPPPPPQGQKSRDWADVLFEQGKEGFPKTW
ncbi:MAG: DUF7146 domain-containing protein [Desulfobaccales bacterium]